MAETHDEFPEEGGLGKAPALRRQRWTLALAGAGSVVLVAVAGLWLTRDRIVENIIGHQLQQAGIRGTYRLESAGVPKQVLTHVVIGDPAHPDLTIERAEVIIAPRFGFPAISEVRLVRPRLYGSYHKGVLSLGSLDKLLFGGKRTEPFRLPDIDLRVDDGRALVASDAGAVGIALTGRGNLSDGFSGELGAIAPKLSLDTCHADRASVYGTLATSGGRLGLTGPLRLSSLDCGAQGLRLRQAEAQFDGRFDPGFDGGEARLTLATGPTSFAAAHANDLGGKAQLTFRRSLLTARYEGTARGVVTPQGRAGTIALSGMLRGQDGLSRLDAEGSLTGAGLRPGAGLDGALARARSAAASTPFAPLLDQMHAVVRQHAGTGGFKADYIARRSGGVTSIDVPRASLTDARDTLLSLSRLQVTAGQGPLRLAGNFASGGAGLPRVTGRVETRSNGTVVTRLALAEYHSGAAQVAVPELAIARASDGAIGLSGKIIASGPIPGGSVSGLELPIDGRWEPGGQMALWRGCRALRFASLRSGDLNLDRSNMTLCPTRGGAMARTGRGDLAIAARAPSLALTGKLGTRSVRIASGPVTLSGAGLVDARKLSLLFGAGDQPTRLAFAQVTVQPGKQVGGAFAGGEGELHGVPLSLRDAAGSWHFAGGKLAVAADSLRLLDRAPVSRFHPLLARGAVLDLAGGHLSARLVLREPASDRAIADVTLAHDLDRGTGNAVFAVRPVTFDHDLQPDTLTPLALGVVANASGTVQGEGRIDWNPDRITSSGRFSSDGLSFAAAFGPAEGVSGTVVFTDLLGLVTAPDQKLKIASINPGIEANDGELSFALQPQGVLVVNGASWPFLDGRMTLLPSRMKLGVAEVRRYELKLEGISATRFVEKTELGNIAATGVFDGRLPLVFDQNGGRIEGGSLISRAPGGNVSYVGTLTYKDLSPMANFAFNTLRSLDYRRMAITLDGDLTGEIVTRVRFDGVKQGAGAKRNFVTRRLGRLPIQMNVNLKAPFFSLISSFKRMYDPKFYTAQLLDQIKAQAQAEGLLAPSAPPSRQSTPPRSGVQPPAIGKKP